MSPYGTAGSIAHQVAQDLDTLGLDDVAATWTPAEDVLHVDLTVDDPTPATLIGLHILCIHTWNGTVDREDGLPHYILRAPHPGRHSPLPTDDACAVCATENRPRFQVGHRGEPLCIIHHDLRHAHETPQMEGEARA